MGVRPCEETKAENLEAGVPTAAAATYAVPLGGAAGGYLSEYFLVYSITKMAKIAIVKRLDGTTTRMKMVKRRKGKKVARLSKPVKNAVKRMISATQETKYVSQVMTGEDVVQLFGDVYPQGTPNGPVQLWPITPDVSEGDTEYTRDGVKIFPKSLVADVDLKFNNKTSAIGGNGQLDNTSWDVTAHVWWGYARRYKNYDDIVANKVAIVENMLEDGQGASVRWLGGPLDHQLHQNNEFVVLKHKAVRMYRPLGVQNTATLAGGVSTYYPQEISRKLKCRFKLPKSFMYNENLSQPENYAPFVIIGYQHNDNTQAANTYGVTPPLLPTQAPALITSIRSHLYFKDS